QVDAVESADLVRVDEHRGRDSLRQCKQRRMKTLGHHRPMTAERLDGRSGTEVPVDDVDAPPSFRLEPGDGRRRHHAVVLEALRAEALGGREHGDALVSRPVEYFAEHAGAQPGTVDVVAGRLLL